MSKVVPLRNLSGRKYGILICYPRFTREEFSQRLKELRSLSVKSVELSGSRMLFGFPVLGKGYSSIVVVAKTKDKKRCALKVRRVDAGKPDTSHEVKMLTAANGVGVGPALLGYTKNLILLELVEGKRFGEWVATLRGRKKRSRLKSVLKKILEQCRVLDVAGLDHGELSRASKHIIVDGNDGAYLIDFEKASLRRGVSNVTSICQYLFVRGEAAGKVRSMLGGVDGARLLDSLRRYKNEPTDASFDQLLLMLHLP